MFEFSHILIFITRVRKQFSYPLVPWTSHVKAKFLPVPYNQTEVLAHPADY